MENNGKMQVTVFKILAVILGVSVFRQFDFETLRFKNLGLGLIYLAVFIVLVFQINKDRKTKE